MCIKWLWIGKSFSVLNFLNALVWADIFDQCPFWTQNFTSVSLKDFSVILQLAHSAQIVRNIKVCVYLGSTTMCSAFFHVTKDYRRESGYVFRLCVLILRDKRGKTFTGEVFAYFTVYRIILPLVGRDWERHEPRWTASVTRCELRIRRRSANRNTSSLHS
jgi:hypothetical protein